MSEFIKRNKPVFIIGVITALVFLIIIAVSQSRNEKSLLPGLVKVNEEEFTPEEQPIEEPQKPITEMSAAELDRMVEKTYKEGYSDNFSLLPGNPVDEAVSEKYKELEAQAYMTPEEVTSEFGDLNISYTDDGGYEPRKSKGYKFQTVVWTNNSDRAIKLVQLNPLFNELANGITLQPGESYAMEMYKEGNFRFTEDESRAFGSIAITRAAKYEAELN